MAFKLDSISMTSAIGESSGRTRYVYLDKKTGQTMSLLEPLHESDDVESLLKTKPTRAHTAKAGTIQIVTTWRRPQRPR